MNKVNDLPLTSTTSPLKAMFICRGSTSDGIGHITRTRAVASAMRRVGMVKIAVIGEPYIENLLSGRNLDYVVIPNEHAVVEVCKHWMPQVVIFDLTYFDEKQFQDISKSTVTVSLSPIFNCLTHVDVLFHRSTILPESWPVRDKNPLIRNGLEYAIVGEECDQIPEDVYRHNLESEALSIAVSMGGTDAANKTIDVLTTLKQVREKLLLWVLLGEGYGHSFQDLVDTMRGSKHEIILAKTNDSMWRILSTSSLAILAGGTTTYEAAYAGLPSVNTLETDQHFFLIQELVEKGVSICTGKSFAESLRTLTEVISYLNEERRELMTMHLRSKNLIDGLGARRIISEIRQLCQNGHLDE